MCVTLERTMWGAGFRSGFRGLAASVRAPAASALFQHFHDFRRQLILLIGFTDPWQAGTCFCGQLRVPGRQQDWKLRPDLASGSGKLCAIHPRHRIIRDE
jgi:hypothetical protein